MQTPSLPSAATRIALAIVLDAAALIVWDVGTRPPRRLVADVRSGLRDAAAAVRGLGRFAVGGAALLGAAVVSAPVAARTIDFTVVECWALIAALIVEQLVGPDIRARLFSLTA